MLAQIVLFDGFDLLDAIVLTKCSALPGCTRAAPFAPSSLQPRAPGRFPGINGLSIPAAGKIDLARADLILVRACASAKRS